MKYLYISLFSILSLLSVNAQVGIGTTTPNAQLDIKSSNQATPANNDGILIPKVDAFPSTNPTSLQDGMMVYLTTTAGSNQPGFYYWDNSTTSWKGVGSTNNVDGWALLGNSGTNPSINFIGTTDDNDVVFRRNNTLSGKIGFSNTSFGLFSEHLTFGNFNTAFGAYSMYSASGGSYNSAFGNGALYSNTGQYNTAVGANSLFRNTYGENNLAFGPEALFSNISGSNNIAIGKETLLNNESGSDKIAIGHNALHSSNIDAIL